MDEDKMMKLAGHGAFSEYNRVNDMVGLVIHSALLTPYHSWKISHRKHHSNTGSCENDEAFVPFTENQIKSLQFDIANDSPIFNLMKVVFFLVVGWMPTYLGSSLLSTSLRNKILHLPLFRFSV